MAKSLFITATGTDTGKTYISALIVKKMRENGYNCGYFKPVLSGAIKIKDSLTPGDCKYVVETSSLDKEPAKYLSYCFEEAVSPHLAASRSGIKINKEKILSDYKKLAQNYDYMVVEGAGGITCPLILTDTEKYLMSDLICDMRIKTILVADGGLGTLNYIALTSEYAKQKSIDIKGVILNRYNSENFMYQDNLDKIPALTGLEVIATVEDNSQNINISADDLEKLFSN